MTQSKKKQTIGDFLKAAKVMSRGAFLKTFTEPILIAMGVLETEEIRARCGRTTELHVSRPATHNPRKKHPLAGRVFPIPIASKPSGSLLFGREEPADVIVPDETVSFRHCLISWDDLEVTITDLGSTNGTLVNLRPLRAQRPTELLNEDIITVGRHSFQYFLPSQFHRVLQALSLPTNMPGRS